MMKKLLILLVFWIATLSSAWAFESNVQRSMPPAYQFQSTSAYKSMTRGSSFESTANYTPYTSTPSSGPSYSPRRRSPWDEDGDPTEEGIGNVNTLVGEPYTLLLMAALYLLLQARRRKMNS